MLLSSECACTENGLTCSKQFGSSCDLKMMKKRHEECREACNENGCNDSDALIKSFSPLFSSMKIFGVYFNIDDDNPLINSPDIADVSANRPTGVLQDCKRMRLLNNSGRIYGAVVLVLLCTNIVRLSTTFSTTDKFDAELTGKLVSLSFAFLCATMQLSYFVACGTRRLNSVLRSLQVSTEVCVSVRKKAIILTVVVWIVFVQHLVCNIYSVIVYNDQFAITIRPIAYGLQRNSTYDYALEVGLSIATTLPIPPWLFPLATNHILSVVMRGEFQSLTNRFQQSIDHDGLFHGNLRDMRRRHQTLSCLVKSADQFIKISNVGGFICHMIIVIFQLVLSQFPFVSGHCTECHMIIVIFLLYSRLFHTFPNTVSTVASVVTFIFNNAMMMLTIGNGILVNHAVIDLFSFCC